MKGKWSVVKFTKHIQFTKVLRGNFTHVNNGHKILTPLLPLCPTSHQHGGPLDGSFGSHWDTWSKLLRSLRQKPSLQR